MRSALVVFVSTLVLAFTRNADAWIFHEHADVAEAAFDRLTPDARDFFAELWSAARAPKACPSVVAEGDRRSSASCIDFPTWSAIAGDHSCSPEELLDDVLVNRWISDVAKIGADTKAKLARARSEREILEAWSGSDLALERADARYSARAVTNNAHFLLARATNDGFAYADGSIAPDAALNALGLIVAYHVGALRLARGWRTAQTSGETSRAALARRILATEAFALHFLEDSFSAGHAAGTWGDAASRKGTHDYYCTHGFDTLTWRGEPATLFGDAHMKPTDLDRVAGAVAASLSQVYEVTREGSPTALAIDASPVARGPEASTFNSCKETKMGSAGLDRASLLAVSELLFRTPYPAQTEAGAPLPRFRAELGPFIGVYSSGRIAGTANGFNSLTVQPRPVGALDVGIRVGLGVERLVGAPGLTFAQAGVVNESAQVQTCSASGSCTGDYRVDSLLPEVPARTGLTFRLHLPFWLIPGDLLVIGPFVALASFRSFVQMAILAGGGGLIPWQRDLRTSFGTFQFIAGRDAALTLYGYVRGPSVAVTPLVKDPQGRQQYGVVELRTMELEFPLLEYRPFHAYGMDQAFTLGMQLGYAVDIPTTVRLSTAEGIPAPSFVPSHMATLRLVFDVRHYL